MKRKTLMIKTVKHWSRSKLHLNRKGTNILLDTLVESISNAFL